MRTNSYFCNEPTIISFSGGRTSAYMLYKTLEAHNGTLPDDVKVCFANTGKEMLQTLQFVDDCSKNWNVEIVWLEYTGKKKYKVTNFEDSSKNGEPFDQLTTDKNYLPNMVARFCTSELKVLTINRYLADQGFDEFQTMVGIRADEPRRVVKMRSKDDYLVPLADEKITKEDIFNFWSQQPFDLQMPNRNGVNDFGNCDLCFLKGGALKMSIIEQFPEKATWWAEQEKKIGGLFRSDQPSYERMQIIATDQGGFDFGDDESISCFCGD
jgi:3'-phosphoadenosine 5'-phosphosulfate sulfotransferase (PAPS reductase)/FAD synthetase